MTFPKRFGIGCAAVLAMIAATAQGGLLYESAISGPTGQTSGGGVITDDRFFSGQTFFVDQAWDVTAVGAHLRGGSGSVFAALATVDSKFDTPSPTDLSGTDVLTTTLVQLSLTGSDNVSGPVDLRLEPGWYALVFGSGKFGATSSFGSGLLSNNTPIGSPYTFAMRQSDGAVFGQASEPRIFIEGALAVAPPSGTVPLVPLVDALVDFTDTVSGGASPSVDETGTGINVQKVDFADVDRRGILEFDLNSIPAGSVITSAVLELDVNTITSGPGELPEISVHAYAGNGTAEVADGETPDNLVAREEVPGLGFLEVALNVAMVEATLNSGRILGLRIANDLNPNQIGFATTESQSFASPVLRVTYIPEPATTAGLVVAGLFTLLRRP